MSYPVKLVKVISPIALAISLAACGGDSATFGNSSGPDVTQSELAKSIELSTSTRQLSSDGSVPIIITAIAKNKNNNAISDAKIVFSVNNQATIIADASAEGAVKTASLTPGTAENRTLTVTATSGTVSESLTVDVVGTKVVIDGPASITLNKEVPFVLKLTNGAEKPITNEKVTLISTAGNTITTDSNFETDENGEIAFKLVGTQGGNDTLKVDVLGVSLTKAVSISPDEFVLSSIAKELDINTSQDITFVWKKSGVAQANKDIYISTTRGDPQNLDVNHKIKTNSLGEATVKISSSTAGGAVITATSDDGLSTSLTTEFIATTPAYLNTQADPTLIKPNGSSTIIAKIRDINDNPVKNKTIDFRLEDTVDGSLSASTAVTDSLGRASVSYTAGDSSSAKDGVIINTFIHGYEEVVDTDPITLTVGSNARRIVLGHDHLESSTDVFYVKNYGVIVTDSAGNPVKDQKVDFTITPTDYLKGKMAWNGKAWRPVYSKECKSEDFDNDGKLDAGEDINRNGVLDPTQDASITGTGITDKNGRIVIEVIFPKSRAEWSRQKITSSVVVEGTEFIENTKFILPVLAADVGDEEVAPPNMYSPYGNSDSCDTVDGGVAKVITSRVVDAITGLPVVSIKNNTWYKVTFIDNEGNVTDEPFTVDAGLLFGKATVEEGPNKSFRIVDRNPNVNSSGFYLTLKSGGIDKPLYYQDDAAQVITNPDGDAPILTLNGSTTMTVDKDSVFTDPRANAVDAVDGVVTVTSVGTVNTAVEGTYTIIYTAKDRAGNSSSLTRTVIVEDTETPDPGTDPGTDVVLGAVEYVGAAPKAILLQGMSAPGLQHTSTVTFLIKDNKGNPMPNQDVSFELSTSVGGTSLTAASVKTDSDGFAKAILQAGSVHTSVRVRATAELGTESFSSESSQIIISTGIADQNSLSLALEVLNPSAWNYDGTKVKVIMHASDRYNNPVPDGTTVAFYTELGQIQPHCQTIDGACDVEWTSADPRDIGTTDARYIHNGVSTITATVIGEESFIDTNSNGIFDDGDQLDTNSDLGEAFEDYNKNNVHDNGLEPYLDFDNDGIRDANDGLYTGLACNHSTLCAPGSNLKDIYTSIELVLAENVQNVVIRDPGGNVVTTIHNNITYSVSVSGSVNGQVPPVDTTISASSDEATIVIGNATVGSTNAAGAYIMPLRVKDSDPLVVTNGTIKIEVQTPRGNLQALILNYVDD